MTSSSSSIWCAISSGASDALAFDTVGAGITVWVAGVAANRVRGLVMSAPEGVWVSFNR
ncbi:MAG TPA: hypothetical protein PKW90_19205 [Myxococcota bacterium]|nr:hypothetical protein [Myxococcota bacterium]